MRPRHAARCPTFPTASSPSAAPSILRARRARLEALRARRLEPGFWDDPETAAGVEQEISAEKDWVEAYDALAEKRDDVATLLEMQDEVEDADLGAEIERETAAFESALEAFELRGMLAGPDDRRTAIVTINSGAGGDRRPGLVRDAVEDVHPLRRAPRLHPDAPRVPGGRRGRHQERLAPRRRRVGLRLPPRRERRPPAGPHQPVRLGRQAPDVVRERVRLPRDRRRHRGSTSTRPTSSCRRSGPGARAART